MAKIRKKKIANPIIPPRLYTDDKSVEIRILIDGMVLKSFRGLSSLTVLMTLIPEPPLELPMINGSKSLAIVQSTTKKSNQFHVSLMYAFLPQNPIAMTLSTHSKYTKKLKKGSVAFMNLFMGVSSLSLV
jgi:hypothetical protein